MQRVATWLVRLGVTPNAISIAGMVAGILAGVCLASTAIPHISIHTQTLTRGLFVLAAIFIQVRLLCNLLDGMVAIEGSKQTRVGVLYNELPDRVSDVAVLIGAGYAVNSEPALGWLASVLAAMTAYIRAVGKAEGTGNDFSGPMAKPQRMATITVACLMTAAWPMSLSHILPREWFVQSTDLWVVSATVSFLTIALAVVSLGCVITCLRRIRRMAFALNGAPPLHDA